jgi:endonuclease/exonuclease/phosphatase family metal-dependent hydrolase
VRLDGRPEPRIAVIADVVISAKRVVPLVGAHLSAHAERRASEAARILGALGKRKSQAIVVGDFNEKAGGAAYASFVRTGFVDAYQVIHGIDDPSGFTHPAVHPKTRIDFVLIGPRAGAPTRADTRATSASDHRPVTVSVALR